MSGILMWHVGDSHGSPMTEAQAQATTEAIRDDSVNAESQRAPEWNDFQSDDSGELIGLAPRTKGADTTDTEKYSPWWADNATVNHNAIIDNQVATSGTAAAREMAGEQGHGTMQYANSIEPVIRAGAAFGNDYFLSNPAVIQDGAGAYMTAINDDNWAQAAAQSNANATSRQAYNATLSAALFGG